MLKSYQAISEVGGESDREISMDPACVILWLGSEMRIVLRGRALVVLSSNAVLSEFYRSSNEFY